MPTTSPITVYDVIVRGKAVPVDRAAMNDKDGPLHRIASRMAETLARMRCRRMVTAIFSKELKDPDGTRIDPSTTTVEGSILPRSALLLTISPFQQKPILVMALGAGRYVVSRHGRSLITDMTGLQAAASQAIME